MDFISRDLDQEFGEEPQKRYTAYRNISVASGWFMYGNSGAFTLMKEARVAELMATGVSESDAKGKAEKEASMMRNFLSTVKDGADVKARDVANNPKDSDHELNWLYGGYSEQEFEQMTRAMLRDDEGAPIDKLLEMLGRVVGKNRNTYCNYFPSCWRSYWFFYWRHVYKMSSDY